jgi:hypothetical protein
VTGERVKASSRLSKWNPKKEKLRRVAGGSWSKPPRFATDSDGEQALEADDWRWSPWVKLGAGGRQKRPEGIRRATSPYGFIRGEDPEELSPDVAAG